MGVFERLKLVVPLTRRDIERSWARSTTTSVDV
jgi:hypothetical protein